MRTKSDCMEFYSFYGNDKYNNTYKETCSLKRYEQINDI